MAGNGSVDLIARHTFLEVGVICDRAKRYVRHGLVLKAAADAFVRVGEGVVVEIGGHQALLGERERDAGGVAGDPTAAPLFGDKCGRAAAAGRVKDQVAGVGGHQDAAGDNLRRALDNIDFWVGTALHGTADVVPQVSDSRDWEIILEAPVPQGAAGSDLQTFSIG